MATTILTLAPKIKMQESNWPLKSRGDPTGKPLTGSDMLTWLPKILRLVPKSDAQHNLL